MERKNAQAEDTIDVNHDKNLTGEFYDINYIYLGTIIGTRLVPRSRCNTIIPTLLYTRKCFVKHLKVFPFYMRSDELRHTTTTSLIDRSQ